MKIIWLFIRNAHLHLDFCIVRFKIHSYRENTGKKATLFSEHFGFTDQILSALFAGSIWFDLLNDSTNVLRYIKTIELNTRVTFIWNVHIKLLSSYKDSHWFCIIYLEIQRSKLLLSVRLSKKDYLVGCRENMM